MNACKQTERVARMKFTESGDFDAALSRIRLRCIRAAGKIDPLYDFVCSPNNKVIQLKYYFKGVVNMRVTSKGQVTIPRDVRESMGISPSETEIEFIQDENGRWYIVKTTERSKRPSRFRSAYQAGKLTMSTDEIMALTRGESWRSS
jgi:AbrB family looped-hinge helix DNA binding protein